MNAKQIHAATTDSVWIKSARTYASVRLAIMARIVKLNRLAVKKNATTMVLLNAMKTEKTKTSYANAQKAIQVKVVKKKL